MGNEVKGGRLEGGGGEVNRRGNFWGREGGLKNLWAGEEDVFLVHPQNGLNGLILNWCTGGCWFTPTLVYLWFNGVLFHLCIILTHDFFDIVTSATFPMGFPFMKLKVLIHPNSYSYAFTYLSEV